MLIEAAYYGQDINGRFGGLVHRELVIRHNNDKLRLNAAAMLGKTTCTLSYYYYYTLSTPLHVVEQAGHENSKPSSTGERQHVTCDNGLL
jgi:hypothetical protein